MPDNVQTSSFFLSECSPKISLPHSLHLPHRIYSTDYFDTSRFFAFFDLTKNKEYMAYSFNQKTISNILL